MDRLAAGIMIAIAALVMNGGMLRDAMAKEMSVSVPMVVQPLGSKPSRVLSLILTLEALRQMPGVLDSSKV